MNKSKYSAADLSNIVLMKYSNGFNAMFVCVPLNDVKHAEIV